MTAPSLTDQIASLNAVSEMIAANGGAIRMNGWGDRMDDAQIALGRQRALLQWLQIHGEAIKQAVAKPVSDGAS